MNHHLSKKGYVFLVFFVYLGASTVFNFVTGNLYKLGLEIPAPYSLILKCGLLFGVIYMVVGRFLQIENRVPTTDERNSIALWSFLALTISMLLYTPLAIGFAKMRPELNEAEVKSSALIALAVLCAFNYCALQLNYGPLARLRSANNRPNSET